MCKKKEESIYHLFYECYTSKTLLIEIWSDLNRDEKKALTKKTLLFNFECNEVEKKYLSAYKLAIWKFREQSKLSKSQLGMIALKRIFSRELSQMY